jgi:hypothetical protein
MSKENYFNYIHCDMGVTDSCKNPNSYGVICVRCNACGRFDKEKDNENTERA